MITLGICEDSRVSDILPTFCQEQINHGAYFRFFIPSAKLDDVVYDGTHEFIYDVTHDVIYDDTVHLLMKLHMQPKLGDSQNSADLNWHKNGCLLTIRFFNRCL